MLLAVLPYGTIAGWFTFAAVVGSAFYFGKYVKSGQAGTALGVLESANRILTAEVERLRARVAELERTHTLAPILTAIEAHEERAARRGDASLAVLNMIAERLGPDGNGHG